MDALYRGLLGPGDLAFDIGSHVGDRVASFRRIGARVVAVEPQPALVRTLRLLYGRDPQVRIEAVALGRNTGAGKLRLNLANPTLSTLSTRFIAAARDADGWRGQRWDKTCTVPRTTLDELVERHGLPRFIKIDVEGYEPEVLGGLSRPVEALSFEFTTIQKRVAQRALQECVRLGLMRYNAAMGEDHAFVHDTWLDAESIGRWLEALAPAANSGDIYALRIDHPTPGRPGSGGPVA